MTTNEVKSYLRQAFKLDKRLQREKQKLEKLRSTIEYHSPTFDISGGNGSADKISSAVANILERSQMIDELANIYIAKYKEIENTIKSIDDDIIEEILEKRYLQYMKWEDIAEAMHYSLRRIQQLHGAGLHKISLNCTI